MLFLPSEIVVVKAVSNEPVARHVLVQCAGVPVRFVSSSRARDIVAVSHVLSGCAGMAERIRAGKKVLALTPGSGVIGRFEMPDSRVGCPSFEKLCLASNGCPYHCIWCYLQATYRAAQPFISVHVEYEEIKRRIRRFLAGTRRKVVFNSGELQDSLALEHLTHAGRTFIPFFGGLENGHLYMLTKSDNVEGILDLPHKGHTILAWSVNAPEVSDEFELGAPGFERRLEAARQAQVAGYPVRLRVDPIVPLPGWRGMYSSAIRRIFEKLAPERITIGTLRFEKAFFQNRRAIIGGQHPHSRLLGEMERLEPMLPPARFPSGACGRDGLEKMKVSVGKYSYPLEVRVELFRFAVAEIRKFFAGPIALCKEAVDVWPAVGLDPGSCRCACQLGEVDLTCRES